MSTDTLKDTALETVLRRDRFIVASALVLLTAFAWAYLIWLAGSMDMSDMAMPMDGSSEGTGSVMGSGLSAWTVPEFVFMFSMWAIMMVGMMTPSVAPMVLIYARVARQAAAQGKPFAATGFFIGGYFLAWMTFSLVATGSQWTLESALLVSPAMASTSFALNGILLIAAGTYQWTPQKDLCLVNCQAPLLFIQRQGGFRRSRIGSLSMGFRHGLYCVGCCWALMALLFVGGVMNLMWILAIAIFVLIEKLLPPGKLLPRIAGTAMIAAGIWSLSGM